MTGKTMMEEGRGTMDGGRMTDDREKKAKEEGRGTMDGGRKTEDRGRRTEDGGRKIKGQKGRRREG